MIYIKCHATSDVGGGGGRGVVAKTSVGHVSNSSVSGRQIAPSPAVYGVRTPHRKKKVFDREYGVFVPGKNLMEESLIRCGDSFASLVSTLAGQL